ncbi:anthrone oxygenase family protein [Micromonospora sp. NPDC049559]|uniref:anthrone oxygenase family protein n=1 Tax=Micromonospora sp. NPDC049559 TaxID=3155923 RepID=UPI003420CDD3
MPTALSTALLLAGGRHAAPPWSVAALLLYVARLAVTGAANVPLNNALEAVGVLDLAAVRQRFETPWVRWNLARTVSLTAGSACLTGALAV